jgi:hypothetical protein
VISPLRKESFGTYRGESIKHKMIRLSLLDSILLINLHALECLELSFGILLIQDQSIESILLSELRQHNLPRGERFAAESLIGKGQCSFKLVRLVIVCQYVLQ